MHLLQASGWLGLHSRHCSEAPLRPLHCTQVPSFLSAQAGVNDTTGTPSPSSVSELVYVRQLMHLQAAGHRDQKGCRPCLTDCTARRQCSSKGSRRWGRHGAGTAPHMGAREGGGRPPH